MQVGSQGAVSFATDSWWSPDGVWGIKLKNFVFVLHFGGQINILK